MIPFFREKNLLKKANFLWSFFSSIKLSISLLFLIVVIFIVSTLIPQQEDTSKIIWMGELYHSNVFYILMGLLSINLIICSINRLPLSLRQYEAPHFPAPSGLFKNLPPNRIIFKDKKMEDASRVVEAFLASKFKSYKKKDMDKEHLFYLQKGRFSVFGVYIVHLGVLIIIAGAVIGSIFGFEADVNLKEGEETAIVQLVKGKGTRQLDFSVRCDKFIVAFYDTGAPKTYRSDLSFIKGGRVISKGSTLVNHPVTFDDLRFYQSSYGLSEESKAVLSYRNANAKDEEISVTQGETFVLPEQKAKVSVLRVEDDMMQYGPAVKLNIEANNKNIQFWVFQNIKDIEAANPGLFSKVPLFNPGLFKPLVFSLNRIETQYYTGLRVVRDPGVPFVLAGAISLLTGMIIIFFLSYQRVWVLIRQEPEGVTISAAGHSNRNNEILQRQIDDLCMKIDKEMT
jgi:cytochrome c biogenesis protein